MLLFHSFVFLALFAVIQILPGLIIVASINECAAFSLLISLSHIIALVNVTVMATFSIYFTFIMVVLRQNGRESAMRWLLYY